MGTPEVNQSTPYWITMTVEVFGCYIGANDQAFPSKHPTQRIIGTGALRLASDFRISRRDAPQCRCVKFVAFANPKNAKCGFT